MSKSQENRNLTTLVHQRALVLLRSRKIVFDHISLSNVMAILEFNHEQALDKNSELVLLMFFRLLRALTHWFWKGRSVGSLIRKWKIHDDIESVGRSIPSRMAISNPSPTGAR